MTSEQKITTARGIRRTLFLGIQGENGVRRICFDFSPWAENCGEGTLTLLAKRQGDAEAYPVALTVEGTTAVWTPSGADTAKAGVGQAELVYTVGGAVVKSEVYETAVHGSIGPVGETPPDPYVEWFNHIVELLQQGAASGITYTLSQDGDDPLTLILTSSAGTTQSVTIPSVAGPQGPKGDTGETGPQGPRGETGPAYTLTVADKASIVSDVLGALPVWTGGSY